MDLVRRRDYEGYLCTLLLPGPIREAAFSLRAFNVEIAGIREAVREQALGKMRLQFWIDAVEAIFEDETLVPQQPVAVALLAAVKRHGLSKKLLLKLIESRRRSLSDVPFGSLDEVDKYAHEAFSSLNYLLLESLGSDDLKATGHARHAANQLGMAQGSITLLRAVPYNASRRLVLLPSDLMMEHGVRAEEVVRGKGGEGLRLVVEAVAARAQEHLDNCRFRRKYLTAGQRLLMLPAVAADGYLGQLHRGRCDVFDQSVQRKNSWLPMTLYYSKWKNSY